MLLLRLDISRKLFDVIGGFLLAEQFYKFIVLVLREKYILKLTKGCPLCIIDLSIFF